MNIVFLAVLSFLIGSIPFGILIARANGIDIRKVGSGNIGATNVLRSVGKGAGLFTLSGDILKGVGAVAIARYLAIGEPLEGLIGLIAILGHDFSIFMGFKGGKGVATSLGVLFVYSPVVALISLTLWVIVFLVYKYSSLSAIVSFSLLPLNIIIFDFSKYKFIISLFITLLLLYKHRENIKRLIKSTESKVGQRTE